MQEKWDNDWVRVRTRSERRGARVREDPRRSYTGTKPGQQFHHAHATWRERSNISTFYFTRFPEDATEKFILKGGGMYRRSSSPNKETKGGGGTAS